MNCETVDEALGAFALDALSNEETRDVQAHLELCRRHDKELSELQRTAGGIAIAAPEQTPAPALRGRLLEAFDAEAAPRVVEPARAGVPWRLPQGRASAYLAVAAVLVLAVIGLATWNVILQTGGDDSGSVEYVLSGDAGTARVLYVEEEGVGVIELDLAPLPADRDYQAWAVFAEEAVSLGVIPSAGLAAFDLDLADADAVAISVEPAGGSEQPSSDPVLLVELDS